MDCSTIRARARRVQLPSPCTPGLGRQLHDSFSVSDDFCRHSSDNLILWNVRRHYRSSRNNRPSPNLYPRHYNCISTHPHIILYDDLSARGRTLKYHGNICAIMIVHAGYNCDIGSDHYVISDVCFLDKRIFIYLA